MSAFVSVKRGPVSLRKALLEGGEVVEASADDVAALGLDPYVDAVWRDLDALVARVRAVGGGELAARIVELAERARAAGRVVAFYGN